MSVTLISPDPPVMFMQFEAEPEPCTVEEFRNGEENEALDYLNQRPVQTVFMAGLIRDNGLVSPHNRGSFYACRNPAGQLEGISLIGNATVVETQNDCALMEFAKIARHCQPSVPLTSWSLKSSEFSGVLFCATGTARAAWRTR